MSRLPTPGSDEGNWGEILNDFLSQAHNDDGSLRDSAVTSGALGFHSVVARSLAADMTGPDGQILTLDSAAPGGFRWASATITTPVKSDWNATSGAAQILNKPILGTAAAQDISYFSTAAQGAKADSAIQPAALSAVAKSGSYNDLSHTPIIPGTLVDLADVNIASPTDNQVLSYDSVSTHWVASTVTSTIVTDATSNTKGIIQLTGDLGGTAASPTVPNLANKADVNNVYSKAEIDSSLAGKADSSDLSNYVAISSVGAVSGVAELDANGKVPASQLPPAAVQVSADWDATTGVSQILHKPSLGTAAAQSTSYFATAAQGLRADTAVQPDILTTVATSGSYLDLSNKPVIPASLVDLDDTAVNTPTQGQVLTYDSSSALWKNQSIAASPISSVYGRTGSISAQSGDYTAAQVGAVSLTGGGKETTAN